MKNKTSNYLVILISVISIIPNAVWAGWINVTVDSYSTDPAVLVGRHPSIAMDANAKPHISYQRWVADFNAKLYYATLSGNSWNIEYISTNDTIGRGDVGAYSSIAVDSNNIPHISCFL